MTHKLADPNIVKIHSFYTSIDWHFGNQCQYACSYCPAYLHANDSKKMDLEKLKLFVATAQQNLKFTTSNKTIKFTFAGGEPTLNSAFGPLIKWLKEEGHSINLVSNGGRTIRWWKEWGSYLDTVVLSFHTEETDLDHFVSVVEYMSTIVRTEAHIIAWPHNFSRIKEAHKQLTRIEEVKTFVKRVNQSWVPEDNNFRDYTEEESNWINSNLVSGNPRFKSRQLFFAETADGDILKDHPMIMTNAKLNKFYGWSCSQGVSNLSVNVYGEVFGAHCKQLHMGNIYELEKINWVKEPSLCNQAICTCISDILITKNKINC